MAIVNFSCPNNLYLAAKQYAADNYISDADAWRRSMLEFCSNHGVVIKPEEKEVEENTQK